MNTKLGMLLKISLCLSILSLVSSNGIILPSLTEPLDYDTELTQKLPDAIIIGSKKCGTRALLKFIGAHPNVSTTGAEVHFFDRFYHMGIDWYKEQMPFTSDDQLTIEKTPKYLVDRRVPRRVFRMSPKMKLIVVLRNPVDRAISEYVQGKEKRRFPSNKRRFRNPLLNDSTIFEQMIYDKHHQIKVNKPLIRNGLFIDHLQNWLKFFPLEQFVFINGESLVKTPSVEIEKLQHFLNLKQVINKEHFVHNHRKGFPCIYKPLDSQKVKCLNDQKGRVHPKIDKRVVDDLHEFYRPYNQRLFDTIGQKPWWS